MAGLETAHRDIEFYLDTNWSDTDKELFNSEEGEDSTEHVPLSQGDANYISIQVHQGLSEAAEVGAGLSGNKRSKGILRVLLHVKRGAGTRVISQYLDTLAGLLEYKTLGTVHMKSFMVAPGFPQDKWFVTPVMFNFYFDR